MAMTRSVLNRIKNRWEQLIFLIAFVVFLVPTRPMLIDLKVYWGLASIFILPGYVVFNLLCKDSDKQLDLLERIITYLGISIGLLLIPWVLGYFLQWSLEKIGWSVCVFDIIGLSILSVRRKVNHEGFFRYSFTSVLLAFFILLVIFAVYLYGGRLTGDSWGYIAWLRNVYSGDVSPEANIFGSWEVHYPFFKNIFSELLLLYAMCAKVTQVDPVVVWCRAFAFFAFFTIAANYSLTKYLFRRKKIAYISILLTPLIYIYPFKHALMDSHWASNFVFLPIAILFSLRYILDRQTFYLPLIAVFGLFFAIEHPLHFTYLFWLLGGFGATLLLTCKKFTPPVFRIVKALLLILLTALPFLLYTTRLALSAEYTPWGRLDHVFQFRGSFFWATSSNFFIVSPFTLLSVGLVPNWGIGLVTVLGSLLFFKNLRRTKRRIYLLSNIALVLLIGLNPVLAPLLGRIVSLQAIHRLGELLPAVPIFSFLIFMLYLKLFQVHRTQASTMWVVKKKKGYIWALYLIIGLVLIIQILFGGFIAAERKFVQILYAPTGVSPNWIDRKIRGIIDANLASFPQPILEEATRLTRNLDKTVIDFINANIEDNSVFLSDQLAERNLPVYTNQLTFLGRRGWLGWGDTCEKVRELGVREAFPLKVIYPEQKERLIVACSILNPDIDVLSMESLLQDHSDKIDYILVTPSTAYLEANLDQIIPEGRVYTGDGFIIYNTGRLAFGKQ